MSPPGADEGDAGFWSPSAGCGCPTLGRGAQLLGWWLLGGTQAGSIAAPVFLETSAPRAWHSHWAATKEELQKTCK